jgi:hypothetical protein
MRMPTRLGNGEGRVGRGRNRQAHPFWSAGVVGTARWQGNAGYRGRPDRAEVATPNAMVWWRFDRESDRSIRPLMPGNAGGGKGPDFRHALEEGEETVTGDEPPNT